jgi:hypothetical protein
VTATAAAVRDIARLYERQGYEIVQPSEGTTWLGQGGIEGVDLVARRGDEMVFVQVKRATRFLAPHQDETTLALAKVVATMPGARLDVVVSPDPSDSLPDHELLQRRAEDSLAAAQTAGRNDSETVRDYALVMASAVAEGALRVLAYRSGIRPEMHTGLAGIAATLRSEGLIWSHQWELLDRAGVVRDALVHGLVPGNSMPISAIVELARLGVALAEQCYLEQQDLLDWFRQHYEDPANGVPFDSAEGGYQYVNGGPYDAREVLQDAFEFVPVSVIDEAVNQIEAYGADWVKIGDY